MATLANNQFTISINSNSNYLTQEGSYNIPELLNRSSASTHYTLRSVKIIKETISSKNTLQSQESELVNAAFIVNNQNEVQDTLNNYLGLPCPKYCDKNKEGVVYKIDNPQSVLETVSGNYSLSLLTKEADLSGIAQNYSQTDINQVLAQTNCVGLAEIIIQHSYSEKKALIGLKTDGRVLQNSMVALSNAII